MKVALCLLALGGVAAQQPPDSGNPIPPSASDSKLNSASSSTSGSSGSSGSSGDNPWTTTGWRSGSGSYGDAGYTGGSSVGGSGSGWVDVGWDGSSDWDPSTELWHFRPSWNWDSPSPPQGTMYVENWGNPPTPEIPSRRSFYFAADKGVSLEGASGGFPDCGDRHWCVHLTFHSSYGVLSDFDAFVLDRYDSADRLDGSGFWNAQESREGAPKAFAPLVLGGFSPEEKAVMGNISSWRVEEMARRFNDTRTTTWTLYPDSDEVDVILSFKQLYTLLPGYPDGNITQHSLNSEVISEWGAGDQVLLRVIAKREGSGATTVVMPQVLNFTGSQLFQVESYSSIEHSLQDNNLTATALTLDVAFGRRRYGSGLPWNPARPSDTCDVCNQQVMNHPMVARCLHGRVPESIFQDIYEQAAHDKMHWDKGEWNVGDTGAPPHFNYYLNDVVDACFGLRWLLNGKVDGGSWSSDWVGDRDRRSSSGSGFGDAGYRWSDTGSGSNGDYNKYNDGSSFREPVYRYDDSGSRWSSWGYKDLGSASKFADAGSRGSSSGSSGDPNAGDSSSVRDLFAALSIARETDSGIQCFVKSRCPVGNRNFAEAAGRMMVLEHEPAFVRVIFTDPTYRFYVWMELEGLGTEGQFTTPELSNDQSSEEIADLVVGAVPNASDYNLAVDVRILNNADLIDWINLYNEWIKNYHNSGGSASAASAAWSSYSTSASADGSSFQFPPAGENSMNGFYPNAGPNSASMDGSSPNAGEDSDGSDGSDWYLISVPEPQFAVEIFFRNVSVVPNILDVYVVSGEAVNSAPANMSWDAGGSELRFQLSPLNLSTFEYVSPPPYVNLTWNEDIPEYPDPYWNGSNLGDGAWRICADCTDAYYACDNSTSCSIGVRAFLTEALSPSRFDLNETWSKPGDDIRLWGVDIAPKLRQSASFFTVESYELFVNVMVCVSKYACDLDLPRQAYSYSGGEYVSVEPTLLKIDPARSVFAVPSRLDGGENIVMKYRGKESLFEWDKMTNYFDALQTFIADVMNEYNADESLWTRFPYQKSWVKVGEVKDYSVGGYRVLGVEFVDDYFIQPEMPRFKPVSNDTYDEINSTHWKASITAYRNDVDESFTDGYPLVTWRKLINWLYDFGWDPNSYGNSNITAEDVPICHQCLDSWTICFLNESCAFAMRHSILSPLWEDLRYYNTRSSIDVSAKFSTWQTSADPQVYAMVLDFLSCLDRESCPVGYALPSDPAAPLVPVTTKLVSHFVVNLPLGKKISASAKGYSFEFEPQVSATNGLESWLYSTTSYKSEVEVEASRNGDMVRYDITYYPAVAGIPTFVLTEDATPLEPQAPTVFMAFQLSSNLVQYGQTVSVDLLYYWSSQYPGGTNMFSYSGDISSGTPVCHGCPECWEALARCQNNMDCTVSAREVLIPRLRNATFPLSTGIDADGRTLVNLNLTSTLLSLKGKAFQSQEGWLAFSHLLHALSSCACEVGYGQPTSYNRYLEPTRLHIDSGPVELSVRLYANTKFDVWFDGTRYSYTPPATGTVSDNADAFIRWFTSIANSEPYYVVVDPLFQETDTLSGAVILHMKLYEMHDEASNSQPLVNPNWIPTFSITTDAASADPDAEVAVTPWKISLQSVNRYPAFDRLLDLLQYGAVSDEIPSSGSNGSFTGDECAKCENLRRECFDDTECQSVINNRLIPNLKYMSSLESNVGWYSDMSAKVLGAFYEIQSMEAKQKLLQLLTCSTTKWISSTTGQEGTSCIQELVNTDNAGVAANLEITRATSVFPINIGHDTRIDVSTTKTLYYIDNGIAAELADFMDNQVFGGYTSSGVRTQVTADPNFGTYTVVYDGLTTDPTPMIESQTSSSSIQFKFTSSVSDMLSVFSPWIGWLTPNQS